MTVTIPPAPQIRGVFTTVDFSSISSDNALHVSMSDGETGVLVNVLNVSSNDFNTGCCCDSLSGSTTSLVEFANNFFAGASELILELPTKTGCFKEGLERYRDNSGHPLVYVYKDGVDYTEEVIRAGLSPYYNKYGNAVFPDHHERYVRAELEAQCERRGIWSKCCCKLAAMQAWWGVRACCIGQFCRVKESAGVLDARFDYPDLVKRAERSEEVVVFTEARNVHVYEDSVALVDNGSRDRPFCLKIADVHGEKARKILHLLQIRYMGEPRRGYLYAKGKLQTYRGMLVLLVISVVNISDTFGISSVSVAEVESVGGWTAATTSATVKTSGSGGAAPEGIGSNGVSASTDTGMGGAAIGTVHAMGGGVKETVVTAAGGVKHAVPTAGAGAQNVESAVDGRLKAAATTVGGGVTNTASTGTGSVKGATSTVGSGLHGSVSAVGAAIKKTGAVVAGVGGAVTGGVIASVADSKSNEADGAAEKVTATAVESAEGSTLRTTVSSAVESAQELSHGTFKSAAVYIAGLLPRPDSTGDGRQTITIRNVKDETMNLSGWKLHDSQGHVETLNIKVPARSEHTIFLSGNGVQMSGDGDILTLYDSYGVIVHVVRYRVEDVKPGGMLNFGFMFSDEGSIPTEAISVEQASSEYTTAAQHFASTAGSASGGTLSTVGDDFKGATSAVGGGLAGVAYTAAGGVKQGASTAGHVAGGAVSAVSDGAKGAISSVTGSIKAAGTASGGDFSATTSAVGGDAQAAVSTAQHGVSEEQVASSNVEEGAKGRIGALGGAAIGAVGALGGAAIGALSAFGGRKSDSDAVSDMKTGAQEVSAVSEDASQTTSAAGGVKSGELSAESELSGTISAVDRGVSGATSTVGGGVSAAVSAGHTMNTATSAGEDGGKGEATTAGGGFAGFMSKVTGGAKGAVSAVGGVAQGATSKIGHGVQGAVSATSDGAQGMGSAVGSGLKTAGTTGTSSFNESATTVGSGFKGSVSAIGGAIGKTGAAVAGVGGALTGAAIASVGGVKSQAETVGTKLSESAVGSVEESTVGVTVGSVVESVQTVAQGTFKVAVVYIAGLLPSPAVTGDGRQTVTIRNMKEEEMSLNGWKIQDSQGRVETIDIVVPARSEHTISLSGSGVELGRSGDTITLYDAYGTIVHVIRYGAEDVSAAQKLNFGFKFSQSGGAPTQAVSVEQSLSEYTAILTRFRMSVQETTKITALYIAGLLPNPGNASDEQTLTIRNVTDNEMDLSGWKLKDSKGRVETLDISIPADSEHTFALSGSGVQLGNEDTITLYNVQGVTVHVIRYALGDVRPGQPLHFGFKFSEEGGAPQAATSVQQAVSQYTAEAQYYVSTGGDEMAAVGYETQKTTASVGDDAKGAVSSIGGGVKGAAAVVGGALAGVASTVGGRVSGTVSAAADTTRTDTSAVGDGTKGAATTAGGRLSGFMSKVAGGAKGAVSAAGDAAQGATSAIGHGAQGAVSAAGDGAQRMGSAVGGGLKTAATTVTGSVKESTTTVGSGFKGSVSAVGGAVGKTGAAIAGVGGVLAAAAMTSIGGAKSGQADVAGENLSAGAAENSVAGSTLDTSAVGSAQKITEGTLEVASVYIAALLPRPDGAGDGRQTITIRNVKEEEINLSGWKLQDGHGRVETLDVVVPARSEQTISLPGSGIQLGSDGDTVTMYDAYGVIAHVIRYVVGDVRTGHQLHFGFKFSESGSVSTQAVSTEQAVSEYTSVLSRFRMSVQKTMKVTAVYIAGLMPHPGAGGGAQTITIRNVNDEEMDLSGWKLKDSQGRVEQLNIKVPPRSEHTISLTGSGLKLNGSGDSITLYDLHGVIVHIIRYAMRDVSAGQQLHFGFDFSESGSLPTQALPIEQAAATFKSTLQRLRVVREETVKITSLYIAGLLPNPGAAGGKQTITIRNVKDEEMDLSGWKLKDSAGRVETLDIKVPARSEHAISLSGSHFQMNSNGDVITLYDVYGVIAHTIRYTKADISAGQPLHFGFKFSESGSLPGQAVSIDQAISQYSSVVTSGVASTTGGRISSTTSATGAVVHTTVSAVGDGVKGAVGAVGGGLSEIKSTMTGGAKERVTIVEDGAEAVRSSEQETDDAEGRKRRFGAIGGAAIGAVGALGGAAIGAMSAFGGGKAETEKASDVKGESHEAVSVGAKVGEAVSYVGHGAHEAASTVTGGAKGAVSSAGGRLSAVVSGAGAAVKGGVSTTSELTKGAASAVGGRVKQSVSALSHGAQQAVSEADDEAEGVVTTVEEETKGAISADVKSSSEIESATSSVGESTEKVSQTTFKVSAIYICGLLPIPSSDGDGRQTVTIRNLKDEEMTLSGWELRDSQGRVEKLDITLPAHSEHTISLFGSGVKLSKNGDTITLFDAYGVVVHIIRYTIRDVSHGRRLHFGFKFSGSGSTPTKALSIQEATTEYTTVLTRVRVAVRRTAKITAVYISGLLPSPTVSDGQQTLTIRNVKDEELNLHGWQLKDSEGRLEKLSLSVPARSEQTISLSGNGIQLGKSGGTITMLDGFGVVVHIIRYISSDVIPGRMVHFGFKFSESGALPSTAMSIGQSVSKYTEAHSRVISKQDSMKVAAVYIAGLLPKPRGEGGGKQTVTIRNLKDEEMTLSGWQLKDSRGRVETLNITLPARSEQIVSLTGSGAHLGSSGDTITLFNADGFIVHIVRYMLREVTLGEKLHFGFRFSQTGASATAMMSIKQALSEYTVMRSRTRMAREEEVVNLASVYIGSLIPSPSDSEGGRQTFTIRNLNDEEVHLNGWQIKDSHGRVEKLSGTVPAHSMHTISLSGDAVKLGSGGDTVTLTDAYGVIIHIIRYVVKDVRPGRPLHFSYKFSQSGSLPVEAMSIEQAISEYKVAVSHKTEVAKKRIAKAEAAKEAAVYISSLLPNPRRGSGGQQTMTIRNLSEDSVDLTGWALRDRFRRVTKLAITVAAHSKQTITLSDVGASVSNDSDMISLINASGAVVHIVSYAGKDVTHGGTLFFDNKFYKWGSAPIEAELDLEAATAQVSAMEATVHIAALTPSPRSGHQTIVIRNRKEEAVDLSGWQLKSKSGRVERLRIKLNSRSDQTITLSGAGFKLNGDGDTVTLYDSSGVVIHIVSYVHKHVRPGRAIRFGHMFYKSGGSPAMEATVHISALLVSPSGRDQGHETVTIRNLRDEEVDMSGWKLKDKLGRTEKLGIKLAAGSEQMITLSGKSARLHNHGDMIRLIDASGVVAHIVSYKDVDVREDGILYFSNIYYKWGSSPIDEEKHDVEAEPADESAKRSTVSEAEDGHDGAKDAEVHIAALVPSPSGGNDARQTIVLRNRKKQVMDLTGWQLKSKSGRAEKLKIKVAARSESTITLSGTDLKFNSSGDTVTLFNTFGEIVHIISYIGRDVRPGRALRFGHKFYKWGSSPSMEATVHISAMLVNPSGLDRGHETVSIRNLRDETVDLSGWILKDRAGRTEKLSAKVAAGSEETITLSGRGIRLHNYGDVIWLIDASGVVMHIVSYVAADVSEDLVLCFGSVYFKWGSTPIEATDNFETASGEEGTKEAKVHIAAMVPNPRGANSGNQTIVIRNRKKEVVDLSGWHLKAKSGGVQKLTTKLAAKSEETITLSASGLKLSGHGDTVTLYDAFGVIIHVVCYVGRDVSPGRVLRFGYKFYKWGSAPAMEATIFMSAMLVNPKGSDRGHETITIRNLRDEAVDMSGWTLKDRAGRVEKLNVKVGAGSEETITVSGSGARLHNHGDRITLTDASGIVMHMVSYAATDVIEDGILYFGNIYYTWGSSPIEKVEVKSKSVTAEGEATEGKATEYEGNEATVFICAMLVNPRGTNSGRQTITIRNRRKTAMDLSKWMLKDTLGRAEELSVTIAAESEQTITLSASGLKLSNIGGTITLFDSLGVIMHIVTYVGRAVSPGRVLRFGYRFTERGCAPAMEAFVYISALLVKPSGREKGHETVTIRNLKDKAVDLSGWVLKDKLGAVEKLSVKLAAKSEETITVSGGGARLHNHSDRITLLDASGAVSHIVCYGGADVSVDRVLHFSNLYYEWGSYPIEVNFKASSETAVEEVSREADSSAAEGVVGNADVYISALLPNPHGADRGNETITFKNTTIWRVDMKGWQVEDKHGRVDKLNVKLGRRGEETVTLSGNGVIMNNSGDTITLRDDKGVVRHRVSYIGRQVRPGVVLKFDRKFTA